MPNTEGSLALAVNHYGRTTVAIMLKTKRQLSTACLLVLLLIFTGSLAARQQKPLSERDLIELLAGGVYSGRIEALIEDRGIAFVPTRASLERLRKAGAQESLEHAVAVAPQIMPKEERPHTHPHARLRATLSRPTLPHNQPATAPSIASKSQPALKPEARVAPGTTINMSNWVKYQQYMPVGMLELFQGKHFWKMPPDIEINVGPTIAYSLPRGYTEATRANSKSVRVVHLANGHYDIANYRGGVPFPDPQDPDKGYKLLADLWFAYTPHLVAGTARNPLSTCSETSDGYINCTRFSYVFRQLAYNTDLGSPVNERGVPDTWYTEWMSVEEPEQMRYTTILTLYPKDNQQPKELFTFVPALRRWIRGSPASRCHPIPGTDYTEDDYKMEGFNGGIGASKAQFIGHQQILALTGTYAPLGGDFPTNYYMPLGWPKPSWGAWQLRDVDAVDVRPIASERTSYCYGKRILYEDSTTHYALWEDVYDTDMRLWKTAYLAQRMIAGGSLGYVPAGFNSSAWDMKNDHMTNTSTQSRNGADVLIDDNVPKEYQSVTSYSTTAGLAEIMR